MLPWGHAALGYLLYSVLFRLRDRPIQRGWVVPALAIGTQFPDLVDKPLSWTVTLLPSGRSLGHSLLVLIPVAVCVLVGARYLRTRRAGPSEADSTSADSPAGSKTRRADSGVHIAFLFGWSAHLLGDAYGVLVAGDTCVSYLLWPLVPVCEYSESGRSIVGFLLDAAFTWQSGLEALLAVLAALLWVADGTPGWARLRSVLRE